MARSNWQDITGVRYSQLKNQFESATIRQRPQSVNTVQLYHVIEWKRDLEAGELIVTESLAYRGRRRTNVCNVPRMH